MQQQQQAGAGRGVVDEAHKKGFIVQDNGQERAVPIDRYMTMGFEADSEWSHHGIAFDRAMNALHERRGCSGMRATCQAPGRNPH